MFYLIEIATGDSKIAGTAIYKFNTQNEALAVLHKKIGNARGSDLFTSELVMVIDEQGTVYKREYFAAVPSIEEQKDPIE